MRRLSTTLVVGAVALVLYPLLTLGWATIATHALDDKFKSMTRREQLQLPPAVLKNPEQFARQLPRFASAFRTGARAGQPIAKIVIPGIDLRAVVVQGSRKLGSRGDDATLRAGPGHIWDTSFPGEGSNTAIAGHRTTFTHPFWSLNSVRKGQRIIVTMPYGVFTYVITSTEEVPPEGISVVAGHGFEELTLSTCTPRFTATRRLIVHAKLFSAVAPKVAA